MRSSTFQPATNRQPPGATHVNSGLHLLRFDLGQGTTNHLAIYNVGGAQVDIHSEPPWGIRLATALRISVRRAGKCPSETQVEDGTGQRHQPPFRRLNRNRCRRPCRLTMSSEIVAERGLTDQNEVDHACRHYVRIRSLGKPLGGAPEAS